MREKKKGGIMPSLDTRIQKTDIRPVGQAMPVQSPPDVMKLRTNKAGSDNNSKKKK